MKFVWNRKYFTNWRMMLEAFWDRIGRISLGGHLVLLLLFPVACIICLIGLAPEDV